MTKADKRFDKLLKAMVEGEPPTARKDAPQPKLAKQKAEKLQ